MLCGHPDIRAETTLPEGNVVMKLGSCPAVIVCVANKAKHAHILTENQDI